MASPDHAGAASPLTPDQASAILRKDVGNLIEKVKKGTPLSPAERRHLLSLSAGTSDGGQAFCQNFHELAGLLNVDRKTINRWKKQKGAPEARADGRHDVAAWRQFKSTRKAGIRDGDDELPGERNRKEKLQNDKLAVQIEILKKEWVPVASVEADVGQMVLQAKSVLLGLPAALAPQVVGSSLADAERLIRDAINDALEVLHFNPSGLSVPFEDIDLEGT